MERVVRVSSDLPKIPDFFVRSDSARQRRAATSIFSEKGFFLLLSFTINGRNTKGVDTATSTEKYPAPFAYNIYSKTKGLEKMRHGFFHFLIVEFFIGFGATDIVPEVLRDVSIYRFSPLY